MSVKYVMCSFPTMTFFPITETTSIITYEWVHPSTTADDSVNFKLRRRTKTGDWIQLECVTRRHNINHNPQDYSVRGQPLQILREWERFYLRAKIQWMLLLWSLYLEKFKLRVAALMASAFLKISSDIAGEAPPFQRKSPRKYGSTQ
jgi:hypothetical protein